MHRLARPAARSRSLRSCCWRPSALAHDGGEGTYGEANDKVVTNAGFILIAFFPLFIAAMSCIQWRLEKRKDRRKAAAKALHRRRRRLARRLVAPRRRVGAADREPVRSSASAPPRS